MREIADELETGYREREKDRERERVGGARRERMREKGTGE